MNKIAVVFCFASTLAFSQSLQNAVRNTDNERFSEAEKEFKVLIQNEPSNASNYFYLAENFFAKDELDTAVLYWKMAAEKDPSSAISLVSSGKADWFTKNEAAAKEKFAKALSMTKNKNAEIMRNIAKTYISGENKNLDEAITLLEAAIKLEPKNEDNLLLLGDAMFEKTPDNGSNAIKSYNKVLDINPKSPRGIVRVGKLYQRAQNYELANEKYMEAQKVDPTYAPAYRENAELNLRFNQAKKAQENWKKYLELNNSTEARYRYATAMFVGRQYCDVIPEIESLQATGFDNFYMERMLAYSYAECTTDKEASAKGLAASDKFFAMAPSEKVIHIDYKYKGLLLANANQDSLAIIELEKASSLNETSKKELAGQIAKMYMKAKKYEQAIINYEYKLSASRLNAVENFELGRAYYFGTKDYANADSAFMRVAQIDTTYAPAYFWRARCNFQLDPKNETWLAQPFYEKVTEIVKPEDRTQGSNKSMMLESCRYLGDYYVSSPAKDLEKARSFWTIVKEIEPADPQAKAFFTKYK